MRLLHAGGRELLQDHAREVLLRAVVGPRLRGTVQELVVLVDRQHAMRRQALHRERSRHPDLPAVIVGLGVEVLVVRPGRDGGIDLLLPGDAGLPPEPMRFDRLRRPRLGRLAGNLPLLPVAIESGVQVLAQRLQRLLPALPDDVDLGVVGDRLERDMRHPLVDESLPDVAVRRRLRWRLARDLRFLALPFRTVGEQVVGVSRTHDAGAGESQCDAGGVDGDPAAAPLFGHVGGGARTACGIQDEVAWVGSHQDATVNDLCVRLDYIDLVRSK